MNLTHLRRRLGGRLVGGFFEHSARLAGRLPQARPERHGVEVIKDVAYLEDGSAFHRLDIYRRRERRSLRPIVVYFHGGAFRILSKDTHWVMGLMYAREDFIVFNINYRLAPKDPFPAALHDCAAALAWIKAHAAEYGGDPDRVIFAGESAGANLALAMTIATTFRRDEPYAQSAFETALVPQALVAACGILQVSDPQRFARRRKIPTVVFDRILEASVGYVADPPPSNTAFADPLVLLEELGEPARPLPAVFAPCGTRDPLLPDSRRLDRAMKARGLRSEAPVYVGGVHAFHAFVFERQAKACWADTFAFLTSLGLLTA